MGQVITHDLPHDLPLGPRGPFFSRFIFGKFFRFFPKKFPKPEFVVIEIRPLHQKKKMLLNIRWVLNTGLCIDVP
jgi:hypothetical protein